MFELLVQLLLGFGLGLGWVDGCIQVSPGSCKSWIDGNGILVLLKSLGLLPILSLGVNGFATLVLELAFVKIPRFGRFGLEQFIIGSIDGFGRSFPLTCTWQQVHLDDDGVALPRGFC